MIMQSHIQGPRREAGLLFMISLIFPLLHPALLSIQPPADTTPSTPCPPEVTTIVSPASIQPFQGRTYFASSSLIPTQNKRPLPHTLFPVKHFKEKSIDTQQKEKVLRPSHLPDTISKALRCYHYYIQIHFKKVVCILESECLDHMCVYSVQ